MDDRIKKIKQYIGSAAQHIQPSAGKDIAAAASFRHCIDLFDMQFHQPHLHCINCQETKLVGHMFQFKQGHHKRVVADCSDDALDPLLTAELKIDHTAGEPILNCAPVLFQHQ